MEYKYIRGMGVFKCCALFVIWEDNVHNPFGLLLNGFTVSSIDLTQLRIINWVFIRSGITILD